MMCKSGGRYSYSPNIENVQKLGASQNYKLEEE